MENWIVTIVSIVIICTTAAISLVIILGYMNQRERQLPPRKQWVVELWNIRYGYRVELRFENSIAAGRYNLQPGSYAGKPIPEDNTVSREHILLYEQGGSLWIWNLSTVNPASINGHRLNEPRQLQPGTRIELGNSVFLLTNVCYG